MKFARENQIWIRRLGDIIEQELNRSPEQVNMKLIAVCEAMLDDLMALRGDAVPDVTAMEARLAYIKANGYALPSRRARNSTRVGRLAACIVLAAMLGLGGTAATVSAIAAMRRDDGNTPSVTETTPADTAVNTPEITWEGIRYTALNDTVEYDNIETLLAAQALEIPYPAVLPEGVTITEVSVDVTADPATVTYGFSDPALTMSVVLNTAADEGSLAQGSEAYTAGGMVSYLSETENGYRATVIGAGTVATVEALSRETVTAVLDGMAENTPIDPYWTTMAIHDGYLYYVEDIYLSRTYSVVRRMDLATGEISNPCAVEGCTHKRDQCPFYSGCVRRGFMIFGDWMHIEERYYWDKDNIDNASTWNTQFLYNLKTGEVRQLPAVLRDTFESIRVGNCLYLVRHSDKLTYADGVTRTYSRVYEYNIDTREYRVVYEHNDLIALLYGGNTRVYFFQQIQTGETETITYYSFNPATGEMREEPTVTMRSCDAIYRNRLYSLTVDGETLERSLCVNNVTTGETAKLLSNGLLGFSLSGNGIYYTRMDEYAAYTEVYRRRYAALQEELSGLDESGKTRSEVWDQYYLDVNKNIAQWLMPHDIEIWRCDLNGENAVKMYEIPFTMISASFLIEGDTLYSYADFFDPETGEDLTRNGDWLPVAIDLKTGEVKALHPAAIQ